MNIDELLNALCPNKTEAQKQGFLAFLGKKLWKLYNDELIDKLLLIKNKVNALALSLPNAKEGVPYNATLHLPLPKMHLVEVTGLDEAPLGLQTEITDNGNCLVISGTPTLDALRTEGGMAPNSTFELALHYTYQGTEWPEGCAPLVRKLPFVINQDPRKLWRNIPVDWDHMPEPRYPSADEQKEFIAIATNAQGKAQKDMVAASKRGRSHAQEGKPRDDHFKLRHIYNGWYIMAVADGAGSARYSREGSRIACDTVVEACQQALQNCSELETGIGIYNTERNDEESTARKMVGDEIYRVLTGAAFKAHKNIKLEAAKREVSVKQYATTLLLTVCKHFSFGWFVASFWVGDGAICLYNHTNHTARLLGQPDEGEYAGQTRFITMPDIFSDPKALYQRLRFSIVDDFTALFLMTDGVSDPKFETDANLNNPDCWDALWHDLKQGGVELTDNNVEAQNQLLAWLDFWSPGNHDDRTIAILY